MTGKIKEPFSQGEWLFSASGGLILGARIDSVSEGGAGDRAGLQADDVIVKAGGEAVRGSGDVLRVRKNYRVGEEMPMTVWRDGEYLDVVLDLQEAAG